MGSGGVPGVGGTGTEGGGSGGGASGETASGIPATLETFRQIVSFYGCFGADCHGGNEFNPLDLRLDDDLYEDLTTTISTECDNLPIVDPGNPEGSALIRLLRGPCGATGQMPAGCIPGEGGGCLRDAEFAAVEQWIADGAPPE
jgi:hypothetical protein